jgi:hypothetical protein
MKRRNSLRRGMEQLRRGLLQASRQAAPGGTDRVDVAVHKNIVVARSGGQPGSHVQVSSVQYAPIVQGQRGSGGRTTSTSEDDR